MFGFHAPRRQSCSGIPGDPPPPRLTGNGPLVGGVSALSRPLGLRREGLAVVAPKEGKERVLQFLREHGETEGERLMAVYRGLDYAQDPYLGDCERVRVDMQTFWETMRTLMGRGEVVASGSAMVGFTYALGEGL